MTFDVNDPGFKLADLLALELHKFEDEVSEIVDRAQKEEKMEFGLQKLEETWTKVSFQFTKHKDTEVYTVKMAEEDFEVRMCWHVVGNLRRRPCAGPAALLWLLACCAVSDCG